MNRPFKDAIAIIHLGLSVFVLLSLYSYTPTDSGFTVFASSKSKILNIGGIVGAYVSSFLINLLGASSIFLPFLICSLAILLFLEKDRFLYLKTSLCGLLSMLSLSLLLYLLFKKKDPLFGHDIVAGGSIAGYILGKLTVKYVSFAGAYIIGFTVLIISMVIMTGQTIKGIASKAFSILSILFGGFMMLFNLITRSISSSKKVKGKRVTKHKKESGIFSGKESTKSKQVSVDITKEGEGGYILPPLSLLDEPLHKKSKLLKKDIYVEKSKVLEKKLSDFGISGKVIQILPGPVITTYEFEPASGVKVSKILNLIDDLALAMRAANVRILAPVPGKPVVGIEIPNNEREIVYLKEILSCSEFRNSQSNISLGLGKDIMGEPVITDLSKIPHLLIAGATGSGKSVGVNSMICSILLNNKPDETKLIMIDPKMLELITYDGIPHLITPVVTNPKKASIALKWAVEEMERRYRLLSEKKVKNINAYNEMIQTGNKKDLKTGENPKTEKLPYIVVIIDELADLMMVSSKDVETSLTRLAQMARAAGIHLLLATQRPSVDVLTGIIKANFPSRISFQVSSKTDSRTILDCNGAERLLGKGDSLFLPPGTSRIQRIHGTYVSDVEINRVVEFLKKQEKPVYDDNVIKPKLEEDNRVEEEYDEKYDEALALVARSGQASISMVQRRLKIGYNRAARIIETMEREGVVGPSDGVKPREVYARDI